MDPQAPADSVRRCKNCGALATSDAEWCGQCFASLVEPEPIPEPSPPEPVAEPSPSPAPVGEPTAAAASSPEPTPEVALKPVPTWRCPTCGEDNVIELDVCAVCGTSFADMMRQDVHRPDVDPKDALVRSLIFPGLGHRLLGYPIEGIARGALFAMLAAMTVLVFLTGVRSGVLRSALILFLVMALAVYVGSAYEAHRMAEGGGLLVQGKQLMWITVAAVLLCIGLLAVSVMTTAKR
jgi:hypothetical protein